MWGWGYSFSMLQMWQMLQMCILSHFATKHRNFVAFCDSLFRAKAVPLHRISKRAEIPIK